MSRAVLAAFREAVRRYGSRPDVTGISISIKERRRALVPSEGPVIAIHVARKRSVPKLRTRRIPRHVLGVPTDVIEGAYLREGGGGLAVGASPLALTPGASIARADGSAASFGAVVQNAAGLPFVLCAGHTLREGGKGKKGDPLVHPGPDDAPAHLRRLVARYERVHFGLDAGLARLEAGLSASNRLPDGRFIVAASSPVLGEVLEKHGRTTGTTQAIVQGLGLFGNVFPALHLRPLAGDMDDRPLSDHGDSGAVWYGAESCAAKGLHSQGSGAAPIGSEYGVAAVLTSVLTTFKVTLATGVVTG